MASRLALNVFAGLACVCLAGAACGQQLKSSGPPVAVEPLASAKPDPWNLTHLQNEAKVLSPADIPALTERASAGDARSQFLLGLVYEFGHASVKQDLQQALSWFKKVADRGIRMPQAWVADFYYQGIGVPVDFAEAFRWYSKSAAQNYSWAQFRLGEMYMKGQSVPVDRRQAMSWYRKAADNGDTLSKFITATHYEPTGYETVTAGSGFQARGSGACKWNSVSPRSVEFETGRRWKDDSGTIKISFSLEHGPNDPERLIREPRLRGDDFTEPAIPQYRRLNDGTEVWWGVSWHMKRFLRLAGYARRAGTLYRASAGFSSGLEQGVLDCFFAIAPTLARAAAGAQLTDPVYGDQMDFLGEWSNGDMSRWSGSFKSLGERTWIFAGRLNGYATDAESAMAMLEANVRRRGGKLGARQNLSMSGLQALWAQATDGKIVYYGAVARGGRFYYVTMEKRGSRDLRPQDQQGFLSALQSIRP